jgi:hypothetical protein
MNGHTHAYGAEFRGLEKSETPVPEMVELLTDGGTLYKRLDGRPLLDQIIGRTDIQPFDPFIPFFISVALGLTALMVAVVG